MHYRMLEAGGERPDDTRVRGAGPARKTFVRPKACKAPHPLQPIVRPRRRPADPDVCAGLPQSFAS